MTYNSRSLYRFSWVLVLYTVVVIAWGAWVRISGSGDGCGDHWPLCRGEVVPVSAPVKTWIEVSHRYSTALYGLLVCILVGLTQKRFEGKHPARVWAVATLLFTVTEALIGRELVALKLVNQSTDSLRLIVMPLHLINTSLLLLSTVMAAESIRFGDLPRSQVPPPLKRAGLLAAFSILLIVTSGAVAALGSHLAPSQSLITGFMKDWASDSLLAVRLRFLHPVLALALGLLLLHFAQRVEQHCGTSRARVWLRRFQITVAAALAIGVCTLLSLAPPWLKLLHLTVANTLVIVTTGCIFHCRIATDSHSA